MTNSFLTSEELKFIGFQSIGSNCLISRKASIFTPELISLGDNVRIDDFSLLSGFITFGSFIHVSAYTALYGKFGIEVGNFVTISGRVLIYSQNDDYSGAFLTNPMVPELYTRVYGGKVIFEKHSIVGAGSIVLPSVTFHEGSCAGAMSLIKENLQAWKVYAGVPAKYICNRKNDILVLEKEFLNSIDKVGI